MPSFEHSFFAQLAYIPRQVVARASKSLPLHIDREDLLAAANTALLLTIRRHGAKDFDDIAKISWLRCAGAVRDELRAMVLLHGARRRGVRATVVSLESLPPDVVAYSPEEPAILLGAVQRALEELPPRHRHVVLSRMLEVPNLDVAAELGVSPARVAQIFKFALATLRKRIAT